jgi:hypothetical protein
VPYKGLERECNSTSVERVVRDQIRWLGSD